MSALKLLTENERVNFVSRCDVNAQIYCESDTDNNCWISFKCYFKKEGKKLE